MAAESVGQIGLDLVVNQNGFNRQMNGITSLAKKAAGVLAGAFAITKIVQFGAECIKLGSDLQEVQNVVDTTFTSMNGQVNEFAQNAMTQFGLSETVAKKYMGTFGAMGKAFGFSEQQAYGMAEALTGLSGDVSSFYNISSDEAYTKLKSVFTGETESLKDLGVVMTQAALDQFALSNGFGKTTKSMTEQEKVALRFAFVQKQLALSSGDFARTSDSWANQTRVLKLQFDSLKASIGQGLINVFTPVIKGINFLLGKLSVLASAFKSFTAMIMGVDQDSSSSGMGAIASEISGATTGMDGLSDSTSGVGDSAKKAAKEMKGLMGLDEINAMSSASDSGDSGTSSTGMNFGSVDVGAKIETTGLDSTMKEFVDKIKGWFGSIDFSPLIDSFNRVKESISPIIDTIGNNIKWFVTEVLAPLAKWTIENALPAFFNLLAGALDVLSPILDAFSRTGQWLWDNFLAPIAAWTGGVIVDVLNGLADVLSSIGDWMVNHEAVMDNIAIIVESFAIAWGLVNIAIGIWNVVGAIATGVTTAFGIAVAFLTSPIGLVILAIAAVIAIVLLLIKNWDWVKEVAIDVWDSIVSAVMFAFDKIKGFFNAIIDFVMSNWQGILLFILNPFAGAFKLIYDNCEWFRTFIDNLVNIIAGFFSGLWSDIKNTFSNVGSWFSNKFSEAWEAIKSVFSSVGSFFGGIWDTIKQQFTNIGSAIGDAIGGAFKYVVNSIINFAENTINGFIRAINGAIGMINNIPGVNINTLNTMDIPRLAKGGILDQPTLAMVGEAGKEAVMPLENNTGWITDLAEKVATRMPQGSDNSSISGDIILMIDGSVIGKVALSQLRKMQRQGNITLIPT